MFVPIRLRSVVFFWAVFVGLCSVSILVHAAVDIDLRAATPLGAGSAANFTAKVSDCRNLVSIQVGSDGSLSHFSPAETRRSVSSSLACEVDFSLAEGENLAPVVTIELLDGSVLSHTESFHQETNAPTLALGDIAIRGDAGDQWLDVTFVARDDLDIAYLAVSGVGLRASVLRRVGGVVSEAEKSAYADSNGIVRLYPDVDNQESFSFSLKLAAPLTADEISRDAVILLDAYVVDASGNQTSLSEIAFIGGNVKEQVRGFYVAPQRIVFSVLRRIV